MTQPVEVGKVYLGMSYVEGREQYGRNGASLP